MNEQQEHTHNWGIPGKPRPEIIGPMPSYDLSKPSSYNIYRVRIFWHCICGATGSTWIDFSADPDDVVVYTRREHK